MIKLGFCTRKIISICTLLILIISNCTQSALAQEKKTNSSDLTSLFFFNRDAMSAGEFATVYSALGVIADKYNFFTARKVKPNENLNLIVAKQYNFLEKDYDRLTKAIKNVLSNVNNIYKDKIIAGQQLKTPRLPINTVENNSDSLTQYFDIYKNKVYLSSTKSLAARMPSNLPDNLSLGQASLFAYKLNVEDQEQLKNLLSEKLYEKMLGNSIRQIDTPQLIPISFLEDHDSIPIMNPNDFKVDSILSKTLQGIDKKFYGSYYVLDYFSDICSHGKKVLDVINARFKLYGIDTTNIKINPVSIEYFQNEESSIDFLRRYYTGSKGSQNSIKLENLQESTNIAYLKKIKGKKYQECKDCIPDIFLNALFNHYYNLDSSPEIISTSFYTTVTDTRLMPRLRNSNTNLITAALNNDGQRIEDFMNIKPINGIRPKAIEPLYSYLTSYSDAGCIIVGNRIKSGQYRGMSSEFGNKVTTLGQGTGWGDKISCIKFGDLGTSFATPDVATQLFIAKAYWKSQGSTYSASESRIRLLLASDLDTMFVGKFGSGGAVSLKKLIQDGQGYIEKVNGEVIPITFNEGSYIGYDDKITRSHFRRNMQAPSREGISGLCFIDNSFFAFFENLLAWRKVDIYDINLSFKLDGKDVNINSKEIFSSIFKQITILKNN